MASFDIMDQVVIAENPWSNTDMGRSSHYLRTRATGGVTDKQIKQQEKFADAVEAVEGECSNLEGMARNRCRALAMKERLS